MFPVIGLFLVNFTVIAVEREQATIESDDRKSIIQIRSSNFDDPSTSKCIDVEVCQGDCTFVVFLGETAMLMEKNSAGQIRELTIESREKLNEWSARVEIEDLSLDLEKNPFVDIGTKQYVMTQMGGSKIWRVQGKSHTEFDESKTIGSSHTVCTFDWPDPDASPTSSTVEVCVDDSVPEKRNIARVEVAAGDYYYTSWSECIVTRCVDGSDFTKNCTSKSVRLPQGVDEVVFGSTTSANSH